MSTSNEMGYDRNKRSSRNKGVWITTQDGRRGSELLDADSEYTPHIVDLHRAPERYIQWRHLSQSAGEPGPHDGRINS